MDGCLSLLRGLNGGKDDGLHNSELVVSQEGHLHTIGRVIGYLLTRSWLSLHLSK